MFLPVLIFPILLLCALIMLWKSAIQMPVIIIIIIIIMDVAAASKSILIFESRYTY